MKFLVRQILDPSWCLQLPRSGCKPSFDKSRSFIFSRGIEAVTLQAQPARSQLSSVANIKSVAPEVVVVKMMTMMAWVLLAPQVSCQCPNVTQFPAGSQSLLEQGRRGKKKEDKKIGFIFQQ